MTYKLLHLGALIEVGEGVYDAHVSFSGQSIVLRGQNILKKYADQINDRLLELANKGSLLVSCLYNPDLYKEVKDSPDADFSDCIVGVAKRSNGAPVVSELLVHGRSYVSIPSFEWDDNGDICVTYTLHGKSHKVSGSARSLPLNTKGKPVMTGLFMAGYYEGKAFKPSFVGDELQLGYATDFKFK